jgi:putative ABC transport system permease protein
MRLPVSYGRSGRWWLNVLSTAMVVTGAFAVLAVSAASPASVQVTGGAPGAGMDKTYDLVVRAPVRAGSVDTEAWATSPEALPSYPGGITLAQYETISHLPGVQVAAPLTMVGYVPLTVQVPMEIPAVTPAASAYPVTLTVRLRTDNGLSAVTWDDVTTAYPGHASGRQQAPASVRLDWTLLLPLVAVDPVAESRLLGLNAAVVGGSYLPSTATAPSGPVPMLMAGSIADDEVADVSVDTPSGKAVPALPTLRAATAYQGLIGDARESAAAVQTYWTASPVSYGPAPNGGSAPRQVAVDLAAVWGGPYQWAGAPADAGVLDVAFRSLTAHTAETGAALQAVGVFDPAKIASAPASPSPYVPTLLTGADARSRQLLGGRPLSTDGTPGGYPSPAASLVMPLGDIGAFTGTDPDPVGVIRVRVAGATGGDAASLERIRSVANEIVRATGLRVDAVSATATTRVIDLPAGLHGRPPLQVNQGWYRNDTNTTVMTGVDRQSISLSELELAAGIVVVATGVLRMVRGRRRELETLRALGWGRRQAARQLLAELGLTALAAGVTAVLAVGVVGTVLVGRPAWAWLLSVPAAIAIVFAAWWPLPRSTARRHRRERPAARARRLLQVLVVALACAALSLELAVRWAFRGAAQSWAGRSASLAVTVVDIAAVLVIVALATVMVADLDPVSRRERAAEARVLRAIGWSARDVARLRVRRAVPLGLAGGGIAGAVVVLGGQVAVGAPPPRLIAVAFLAAAAGVLVSLLAAGLSAAWGRAHRLADAGID